jgi:hypothetical protein
MGCEGCHEREFAASSGVPVLSSRKGVLPTLAQRGRCTIIGEVSAHEHREDGRHSPEAVLGFYTGLRYHPEDLRRAFFEARFARVLDALGYARLMH